VNKIVNLEMRTFACFLSLDVICAWLPKSDALQAIEFIKTVMSKQSGERRNKTCK